MNRPSGEIVGFQWSAGSSVRTVNPPRERSTTPIWRWSFRDTATASLEPSPEALGVKASASGGVIRSSPEPSSPIRQTHHRPSRLPWKNSERPSAANAGQPPSFTTRRRPEPSGDITTMSVPPAWPLPLAHAIRSPLGDQTGE